MSWLDAAIREQRGFEIGELRVEPVAAGWDVCAPGLNGDPGCCIEAADTEALRRRVQCDDDGRYRPLTGARSLPGGWHVPAGSDASLRAVLDIVYPLAAHHIAQEAAGALRVVDLDEVLERQSGRYANAATLSDAGRSLATEVVCGQCVREPVWLDLDSRDEPIRTVEATGSRPDGPIPCPEPCSIIVSFCREAAQWEADTPACAPSDPAVGFAAFETPGNALREKWLARAAGEVPEVEEDCSGIPADSRH